MFLCILFDPLIKPNRPIIHSTQKNVEVIHFRDIWDTVSLEKYVWISTLWKRGVEFSCLPKIQFSANSDEIRSSQEINLNVSNFSICTFFHQVKCTLGILQGFCFENFEGFTENGLKGDLIIRRKNILARCQEQLNLGV